MDLLQRRLPLRDSYPFGTSVVPESPERPRYLLAKAYFSIRPSVGIRPAIVDGRTHSQVNSMYSRINSTTLPIMLRIFHGHPSERPAPAGLLLNWD